MSLFPLCLADRERGVRCERCTDDRPTVVNGSAHAWGLRVRQSERAETAAMVPPASTAVPTPFCEPRPWRKRSSCEVASATAQRRSRSCWAAMSASSATIGSATSSAVCLTSTPNGTSDALTKSTRRRWNTRPGELPSVTILSWPSGRQRLPSPTEVATFLNTIGGVSLHNSPLMLRLWYTLYATVVHR